MKNISKKKIILFSLLGIFIILLFAFFCYFYFKIYIYHFQVLPNTYYEGTLLSDVEFSSLNKKIEKLSTKKLNQKFSITCNGKEYSYRYLDLGIQIDNKKISNKIIEYQKSLSYWEIFQILYKKSKKTYSPIFIYDKNILTNFLNELKKQVDVLRVDGHFVMGEDRNLQYISGVDGFSLDVSKSLDVLVNDVPKEKSVSLVGDINPSINVEKYQSIDTKISSFMTNFDPYITRATNLRVALNYIDGVIVEPGEVFSFYKYAGPYNKKGYVFYYEFVGNGVCQIATTIYNTALLGGLEIVKRYPHGKKPPYVPGGLDATVASYSSGWNVDFQFKNTYSYPIYISAYAIGGEAHVDFWSNKNATNGKTYSTESVKIGNRGYTTYLHTYLNGAEIAKNKIATTWYLEE